MTVLIHDKQPLEKWRDGVMTRMRMSGLLGSRQFCIFDQYCDPNLGAPTHEHAVEELLEVMDGTAEIWVGGNTATVTRNQSVLVPAGTKHGFRNVGTSILHIRATLGSPIFEALYEDGGQTARRWRLAD